MNESISKQKKRLDKINRKKEEYENNIKDYNYFITTREFKKEVKAINKQLLKGLKNGNAYLSLFNVNYGYIRVKHYYKYFKDNGYPVTLEKKSSGLLYKYLKFDFKEETEWNEQSF